MGYGMIALVAFGVIVVWELSVLAIAYIFKDRITKALREVFAGSRDQSYKSKEGIEMLSSHLASMIRKTADLAERVARQEADGIEAHLSTADDMANHVEITQSMVGRIKKLEEKSSAPTALQKITSQAKKITTRVSRLGNRPTKGKIL